MENAARLPQLLRGERACENDGKRYAFTTFSTRLLLRPDGKRFALTTGQDAMVW